MNEDATSTTYVTDGIEKLREVGYIDYENGEFVKVHDWLHSPNSRNRFCIICGRREHYDTHTHQWTHTGDIQIMEVET